MTRDRDAGFSLVEILVVLALIGTMAGVTMVSFGAARRGEKPEVEARLLANRLSIASDEALLNGAELSLRLDASGYRIETWSQDRKAWTAHSDVRLGTRHAVADGIAMDVEPSVVRMPIRRDAMGEPAAITFSGTEDRWRVLDDGLTARATRLEP